MADEPKFSKTIHKKSRKSQQELTAFISFRTPNSQIQHHLGSNAFSIRAKQSCKWYLLILSVVKGNAPFISPCKATILPLTTEIISDFLESVAGGMAVPRALSTVVEKLGGLGGGCLCVHR
jgi:hypothetical protein